MLPAPDDRGEIMRPFLDSGNPQTTLGDGDKNGLFTISQPQCAGSGGALQREGGGTPTGERVNIWIADDYDEIAGS